MKRGLLAILVVLIMVGSIFNGGGIKGKNDRISFYKNGAKFTTEKINYEPHDPIRINNDTEFAEYAAEERWPGNGRKGNPYIIEGYEIDGGGYGYCIYIGNTTCYFKIINCRLYNATPEKPPYAAGSGLILYNVSNANISNNIIFNNAVFGIYLISINNVSNEYNNNISSNEIFCNGVDGIYIENSTYNQIYDNTIYSNIYDGIFLGKSINNLIKDNNIFSNSVGIHLLNSCYNSITGNTLYNNSAEMPIWAGGIALLQESNNNNISSNKIVSNCKGIYLEDSYNNLIYNNLFNNTLNAKDNGLNTWNISATPGKNIINETHLGGNYWSDYKGVDYDNDSLGDEYLQYNTPPLPYNCNGSIKIGGDNLPLVSPHNNAPVAIFEPPEDVDVGDVITFDASLSFDPDKYRNDDIDDYYEWIFNGEKKYGKIVTYSYSKEGIYNVTLVVKDRIGAYNSTTHQIPVGIKHSYIEIINPVEDSIYIKGFRVPIPFLGKIICKILSKLYDEEIYAMSIGKKLTVKIDVKVLENESCKEVIFWNIFGNEYYIVDKPPYECAFEVDQTTIYPIAITAICTDIKIHTTIFVHVSPSLTILLRDAWRYFTSR